MNAAIQSACDQLIGSISGPCACMGPQFGEPYCFCQMRGRGLPLNRAARDDAAREANERLRRVIPSLISTEKAPQIATTGSTAQAEPLTIEQLRHAAEQLEREIGPAGKTWRLFAPNGDLYESDDPLALIRVLGAKAFAVNPIAPPLVKP